MQYAVVMAGGAGTRLWPAARRDSPKQLQSLIFDQPLIAVTVERLAKVYPLERILIVTARRYAAAIQDALPHLPPENIVSEPVGRNTAAAIALAALRIADDDPSGVFAVFPADHVILKPENLFRALEFANDLAIQHRVVDIGVPPSHPETGYGYIELGDEIASGDGVDAYTVKRFVEKPSRATAEEYLRAGNYIWNSGMFVWQASTFLDDLATHLPRTHRELSRAAESGDSAAMEDAYRRIEDISVDYAIMEKTSDVVAIPVDFGWRDVGDWAALHDLTERDAEGNAFDGPHVTLDTTGSLLLAGKKLIASIDVHDLVLVDTDDVLLVMRRERAQDVKKILDELKQTGQDKYL